MRSVCRKMKAESKQLGACFSRLVAHTHLKAVFHQAGTQEYSRKKEPRFVDRADAQRGAVCNGNKDASATLVLPNRTP